MRRVLLGFVLALAAAAPLAAQQKGPTNKGMWEIGGFGRYNFYGDSFNQAEDTKGQNSFGGGGRLGYFFSDKWNLESTDPTIRRRHRVGRGPERRLGVDAAPCRHQLHRPDHQQRELVHRPPRCLQSVQRLPHRFLPGGKGGLYDWQNVRNCHQLLLVEGLFDWASLWQAGFRNVTCSLGTCLNATQFRQLCDDATRTVYLAFDSDANGSGQRAAHQIAQRLWARQVQAFPVQLPDGHDPNSFFVHGGWDAHQFRALLERSRP